MNTKLSANDGSDSVVPIIPKVSKLWDKANLRKRFFWVASIVLLVAAGFICMVFDDPITLIKDNWIVTPIAFIAAAFANASAVGGGFLFIPLFIYVYGLTPFAALKLSLATQAFGMSSGAIGWSWRFIDRRALVIGGAASLVGMWVGTYHIQIAPEDIKLAFGWISILIFAAVMIEIRLDKTRHGASFGHLGFFRAFGYGVATFAGGVVTAWTAIGVGEFVALYLMFVYRVRIETAIGTGVAVLALCSIAGLIFHVDLGGIRWDLLAFTVPGVLLGGFFGARAGCYVEQKMFKPGARDSSEVQQAAIKRSPLKWVFSVIILVDGASILIHSYL